jgi:hypothetical protein
MSVEPNSALLGQVSDEQFQSLVDDLLELLAREKYRQQIRCSKRQQKGSISDQPRLAAIVDLILNAIPTTDPQPAPTAIEEVLSSGLRFSPLSVKMTKSH